MALLGRILVILFALFCASLAASAVLTVAVLAREWNDLLLLSYETGALAVVIGLGGVIVSAVFLLPVAAVIAVAEAFAWRSVLFYAALGLVLALWTYLGNFELATAEAGLVQTGEISAAAGIAGGLVYWALAGRRAGAWCERAQRPV
jgi:hypothetical protein